eukprot:401829-Pelagomonas_calceolata.AAC.1
MGAGSSLKGNPGGVMEKIAFKVDTGYGCVCMGVITLNSLDMALDMLTVKLWYVFIVEASTGRTSPGFSYVDLLSLLVSIATKLCQAFPVVRALTS